MITTMQNQYGKVVDLERFVKDGRLTEPSDGKLLLNLFNTI